MVFIPRENKEWTAVQLVLSETWSLREFEELCSSVRGAYELIDRFMTLITTLEHEGSEYQHERETQRAYQGYQRAWNDLYYGLPSRIDKEGVVYPLAPLDQVLDAIAPFSTTLRVGRIRLESPGFLELVGSWNPLRIIADAIRDYRHENTKRMEIETRFALDKEKLRVSLAKEIMRNAPIDPLGERLGEIVNSIIEPSATMLEKVVNNPRVLDAQIVGPGAG